VKIDASYVASVTTPLRLSNPVEVEHECDTTPGQVVVVRALGENPKYPDLELCDGSRVAVRTGDVIATALGSRQALRGFVGAAPGHVRAGDELALLNLGGVVGRALSGSAEVGMPVPVEVLGVSPLHLRDAALPRPRTLAGIPPLILVAGSCMNVGKTVTTERLVAGLTARGLRVGGAKITGVGCLKDQIRMLAAGAVGAYTFLDCGVPSTVDTDDVAGIARAIAAALKGVDVVVMEMGDGVVGHYRVDRLFEDRELMRHVDATVFVASDLTAAWGGKEFLARRGVSIAVVTGAATDNDSGVAFIERELGIPAANSVRQTEKLLDVLALQIVA
jgi:hypothetical protein